VPNLENQTETRLIAFKNLLLFICRQTILPVYDFTIIYANSRRMRSLFAYYGRRLVQILDLQLHGKQIIIIIIIIIIILFITFMQGIYN